MIRFTTLVGVPGSGKSWRAKLLEEHSKNNCKIFSSDSYRKILYGDENCQDNPEKVFNLLYKDMCEHLKLGFDAIFDATNITMKGRIHLLKMINSLHIDNIEKICWVMNTPAFDCIKNDSARERTVGHQVIRKFLLSFQVPQYFEGWDNIVFEDISDYYGDKELQQILIEMNNFNQQNPHHIYSLGQHCANVYNYFINKNDPVRAKAGQLHDIGKLHTQHFDEYGIAHYYSHDNLGAYQVMCHSELLNGMERQHDNFLNILFYINYHMRAHKDFRNPKAYKKYSQIFGKIRLDKLIEFADADIEASGTKDYHKEVVEKIEEIKNKHDLQSK